MPAKITLPDHIRKAIESYIPHMNGWTVPERACEMAAAIINAKAKVCVDIGVYAGRSTIAMGFACREVGGGSMVYGIDPWNPFVAHANDDDQLSADWWKDRSFLELIHRQAMSEVAAHRLEPWVTMIRTEAQYIAGLFPQIDVVNIDGAHGEEASTRDVSLYLPRVVKGGTVFFDDTDWQSTNKAVAMLDAACELVNDTGKARTYRKK